MLRNNKPQKYLTNKRMYEKEYYLKIKSRRYVILPTLLGFFSKVIVYIFANKWPKNTLQFSIFIFYNSFNVMGFGVFFNYFLQFPL